MSQAYCCAAHLGGLAREDAAGRHTEGAEDAAHELGLVAGEVVVDRDDVHAAGRDGVEVGGERRDEGLALTGLHLGDVAEVQGRAAHQLDVEVTHAERALRCLAHGGEGLGEQIVERLAVAVALAQLGGLVLQLLVGEVGEVVLQLVDRLRVRLQPAQDPAFAHAQDALENIRHVGNSARREPRRAPTRVATGGELAARRCTARCGAPMLATAPIEERSAGSQCEPVESGRRDAARAGAAERSTGASRASRTGVRRGQPRRPALTGAC